VNKGAGLCRFAMRSTALSCLARVRYTSHPPSHSSGAAGRDARNYFFTISAFSIIANHAIRHFAF